MAESRLILLSQPVVFRARHDFRLMQAEKVKAGHIAPSSIQRSVGQSLTLSPSLPLSRRDPCASLRAHLIVASDRGSLLARRDERSEALRWVELLTI
jgi:hypothetical protein